MVEPLAAPAVSSQGIWCSFQAAVSDGSPCVQRHLTEGGTLKISQPDVTLLRPLWLHSLPYWSLRNFEMG